MIGNHQVRTEKILGSPHAKLAECGWCPDVVIVAFARAEQCFERCDTNRNCAS